VCVPQFLTASAAPTDSTLGPVSRGPVPDAGLLLGTGDHESEPSGSEASGTNRSRFRLCARVAGVSLDAGRSVDAADREGVERPCR